MKINHLLSRLRLTLANFIANILMPNYITAFMRPRAWVFKNIGGLDIGKNVRMYGGTVILGRKVAIGENTFIGANCFFACSDEHGITIGRNCDISYEVCFACGSHEIGDSSRRAGKGTTLPITIGEGTWIGCRATILGGVEIQSGTVVAAASLVLKNVQSNGVVGGIPAKILKTLSQEEKR